MAEKKKRRLEVAERMREREDAPLRDKFADGEGAFSALGFMFEYMRKQVLLESLQGIAIVYTTCLQQWYGLSEEEYYHIMDCNDREDFGWEDFAEYLTNM